MMPGKSQEISLIPTYKEIFLFICLVLGLGQLSFSVVSSRGSNVSIAAFTFLNCCAGEMSSTCCVMG